MDAQLRGMGQPPVLHARRLGKVAYVSGLQSVLFTFPTAAACYAGMSIATQWYWRLAESPYPDGVWVQDLHRDHWFCICTYYVATDTDWRNAALWAHENRLPVPERPTGPPARPGPTSPTAPPSQTPPPWAWKSASAGPVPPKAGGGRGPLPACGSADNPWAAYEANKGARAKAPPASAVPPASLPVKMPPVVLTQRAAAFFDRLVPPRKAPPAHLLQPREAPVKNAPTVPPPRKAPPADLLQPAEAPAKKMPVTRKPPPPGHEFPPPRVAFPKREL